MAELAPTLPPDQVNALDRACDAFDRLWQSGQRPNIEEHLRAVAAPVPPLLEPELIRIELECRFSRGEQPTAEEYASRFPAWNTALPEWLVEAKIAADIMAATAPLHTPDSAQATTATFDPGHRSASTCLPPRVLGEYELLEKLGAGGMGEVWKARHRRLDRLVAIKLLAARADDSGQAAARFVREMKAVGQLEHPNVIEAHDAGEQNGRVYLVMKLVEGLNLAQLVKQRGPLPVHEACELARQAAVGLQYLHVRGLVHRDLKPSNLMRTPDGTVKILDFGLARWCEKTGADLTSAGQGLGTPDFLAPQQITSAATVDIRADLYGLGGTLFYLLTGQAPFAHRSRAEEKLDAHQHEIAPDVRTLRAEVPGGLADLIARLLAKDPAERPRTPAEVAGILAGFAGGGTELPTTVSWLDRPGRRRIRWAAAVSGLVLVGLLGTLAWSWRPGWDNKIRVLRLDVHHFAAIDDQIAKNRGVLGKDSFAARIGDHVTVEAELSRPAYAFLIAYPPSGIPEVCFPEKEDEPPPLTDQPRYPSVSRGQDYKLAEGEGLQVFALVVSRQPFPAFISWAIQSGRSPWKKEAAPPDVVWWDNGTTVEPLTEDPLFRRAKGNDVLGKKPVADLTDWLRRAPGVEAVEAVGFAVLPKDKR